MSSCISDNFSIIEDPRINRKKLHTLSDILTLTICAMLSGADGYEAIEEFGQNKKVYNRLGKTTKERQIVYIAFFDVDVPKETIEEIREATNKSWVLGSDYFKEKIEDKINRPMNPRGRGGDRKSKSYKENINRV